MALPDIILADYDVPLGNVVFSPDRKVPIMAADLGTFQLSVQMQSDPGNVGLQLEAMRRIIPDATDGELQQLKGAAMFDIIKRACHLIPEGQQLVGESSGASPMSTTSDSSPGSLTGSSAIGSPLPTG